MRNEGPARLRGSFVAFCRSLKLESAECLTKLLAHRSRSRSSWNLSMGDRIAWRQRFPHVTGKERMCRGIVFGRQGAQVATSLLGQFDEAAHRGVRFAKGCALANEIVGEIGRHHRCRDR